MIQEEVVVINQDSTQLNNFQEAERLIDKYGGKAVETFEIVVEKATPLAKEGFSMAVKLQFAQGIAQLIPLILFFVFLFLYLKTLRNYKNESIKFDMPDTRNRVSTVAENMLINYYMTRFLIFGILGAVCFILAAVNTYGGVTRLIAPEWYAVKEIVELFK